MSLEKERVVDFCAEVAAKRHHTFAREDKFARKKHLIYAEKHLIYEEIKGTCDLSMVQLEIYVFLCNSVTNSLDTQSYS